MKTYVLLQLNRTFTYNVSSQTTFTILDFFATESFEKMVFSPFYYDMYVLHFVIKISFFLNLYAPIIFKNFNNLNFEINLSTCSLKNFHNV